MSLAGGAESASAARRQADRHESFLLYARLRFLKIGLAAAAAAVVIYVVDKPYGARYGGTWAGWTLGIVAALLVAWLSWFGWRKRRYQKSEARLAAYLSAHVYLGLSLLVIATLHTGFVFGWNIHTLAYVLLCVVILSGMFGVFCYVRYPPLMTENRRGLTLRQMLGRIAGLDEDLLRTALALPNASAAVIRRAVETTAVGGSLVRQLSGRDPGCGTAAAIGYLRTDPGELAGHSEALREIRVLLEAKTVLLAQARRDVRYKAIMEVWLYIHVPLTVALVAALLAHIVSVIYLW